ADQPLHLDPPGLARLVAGDDALHEPLAGRPRLAGRRGLRGVRHHFLPPPAAGVGAAAAFAACRALSRLGCRWTVRLPGRAAVALRLARYGPPSRNPVSTRWPAASRSGT